VQPAVEPPLFIVRLIEETAVRYRLEKALLAAIVRAESGYDPRAVSRAGAAGLMQLMPETAESLGVRDVFHPKQNLEGGALYFRRLLHRFEGDPVLALAAFNAGPTAVERYGGIPPFPETRSYLRRVSAYRQEYLRSREGLPHMLERRKRPES
jgi:soluble lytic murein transglycosylase-like protein